MNRAAATAMREVRSVDELRATLGEARTTGRRIGYVPTMGANGYIHKDGRIQALPEQVRVIAAGVVAQRAARRARETPA